MQNTLSNISIVDVSAVGGSLSIKGTGGLILPSGDLSTRPATYDGATATNNGLVRFNAQNKTIEMFINGEIITLAGTTAGSTGGTFLARNGGTMTGDLTMQNGTNISLSTTATIDGVRPSDLKAVMDQFNTGSGLLVRTTPNQYTQRRIMAQHGLTVTNGDGYSGNPVLTANDFSISFFGDVSPVAANISGLNSTTVQLSVQAPSTSITDFKEAVTDTVGDMVNNGTRTGLTVNFNDNGSAPGTLDITANPYTITLGNQLVGSVNIPSSRSNVSLNAVLNTNIAEIKMLGSSQNASEGLRFYYDSLGNSIIENLKNDPASTLTFRTQGAGILKTALTIADGNLYANYTTVWKTLNVHSSTNDATANIDVLNATSATLNTATITSGTIATLTATNSSITNDLYVGRDVEIQRNLLVDGGTNIVGDLTVHGAFQVVSGVATQVRVDTSNMTVRDNTITLNNGETGNGVSLGESGIDIDRGPGVSYPRVKFVWEELTRQFAPKDANGSSLNLGRIADPVLGSVGDSQVGSRLYNDNRYIRDTQSGAVGLVVRIPSGSNPSTTISAARTLIGGAGLTVTNGDGQSGNPLIDVNSFTVSLAGSVTGSGTCTGLNNFTIVAATNSNDPALISSVKSTIGNMTTGNVQNGISTSYNSSSGKLDFDVNDFTLTLSGGVTGSALISNLSNTSITCVVSNDSHTHDLRYYTKTDVDNFFEGTASGKKIVDWSRLQNIPSPTVTLTGGVSGVATMMALGSTSITTTVANDSHTHDTRYYTKTETDSLHLNVAGDSMSGTLTTLGVRVAADNTYDVGTSSARYANMYAVNFRGVASSALYADLAERYEADAVYHPGTVVVFGGQKEITTTNCFMDSRVAGVISTAPAYMMNSQAGTDDTHPYVGLKGRVPCQVVGTIRKGDLLITSNYPGVATSKKSPAIGTVFAKAIGEWDSETVGIIEVALMCG